MANNELSLLKRYKYDKRVTRDRDDVEYTWSASEDVDALDVYEYKRNTYVVKSRWHYEGSGDMEGSNHYEDLSFMVYPISPENAESEEAVLVTISGNNGHETRIGDRPQVDISDEEAFTDSIHYRVIGAIDAYIADQKKAEALKKETLPNAVYVSRDKAPKSTTVYDFDSDAGLGKVFYNCTSVVVKPLDEESQTDLGIDRPLCYYYPADRGSIGVYMYISEDMKQREIIVSKGSKFQFGNGATICAYVNGKPAPLTIDEVEKIMHFPN